MMPLKSTLLFTLSQLAASFSGTPPHGLPNGLSETCRIHKLAEKSRNFGLLVSMEGTVVESILLRHQEGHYRGFFLKTDSGTYEIDVNSGCLEIEKKQDAFPSKLGTYTICRCAPFAHFEGKRILTTREVLQYKGGNSVGFDFFFEGLPNESMFLRSKEDRLKFGILITVPGSLPDES